MEMLIVKTVLMKTHRFVTIVLVILKRNLLAKMDVVYQNYGCAISTTIAAMIPTNLLICVDKRIVRQVGNVVLVDLIIVAYPNGFSVMVKTIVATVATNYRKIVHNVTQRPISNAVSFIFKA